MGADLVDELRAIVGDRHVLTDPGVTASYERDWTGRFVGRAAAVVRPATTGEVAAVLAACDATATPVVPQGGNTGLVGGGVPLGGEVLLSLRRLTDLGAVDPLSAQVTAGAGVTLADLQRHAGTAGLAFGIDLAARDTATVGGMVATNAGGVHVLRHGAMRAQVAGVEAVLADGRVVSHLAGLSKDNTGYDLAGLLCGSEGTLAVVTAARLRLVARPAHRATALVAMESVDHAVAAAAHLRDGLATLEAAELLLDDGLRLVTGRLTLEPPFSSPAAAYLLIEATGTDPTDELADAVRPLPGVVEVAVAHSEATRAVLWRYREAHTEVINTLGPPVKLDVTLPMEGLADFVPAVRVAVAGVAPGAAVWIFGHAADGNLHVNVTGAGADGEAAVEKAVLSLVAARGGSISAEHGIGTAKRAHLHLNRSAAEIEVFSAIKRALDPNGILNPGVLLPPA